MDRLSERRAAPAPRPDSARSRPTPAPPLQTGLPWPLGASFDGQGVNFAVFSAHAHAIELCLFDATGSHELDRLRLPGHTHDVFHGYLPGARPGLVYGLRAHGPWRPERGQRFNPNKLLLDPYAREIIGAFEWRPEHCGADPAHPARPDPNDNAGLALKARVIDTGGHAPAPGSTDLAPARPHVPAADTVLYELHVKGFTQRHPDVPVQQRGTYAGLASEAAITHLRRLGVTTLSLLPVHQHLDEARLVGLGLRNYWGYNTVGYFAVEPSLAGGIPGLSAREEFLYAVRRLHRAGIEVLIDVVFNHTAEGDERGPTISWRGLDNASYYRLPPEAPSRYENLSGCGNTLDLRHPRVLQMVMDCLRHWATEFEVDGFRFDLAPVLGRGDHGFHAHAPFFAAVAQDPVLSRLKLVAEPWDLGPGGYQVGAFPKGWCEWNDKFRDAVRSYWLGAGGHETGREVAATRGDFAMRLCGSADLYQASGRAPTDSVNYVVSHDGFTLADLLTYEQRRNEANGEGNRDGHGHNLGWNCGAEGPSDDPVVAARRGRLQRALLASTLLAQGTPMLLAGAELGQSQGGNNNAYCQDNETSWIDWRAADTDLLAFTARVAALRAAAQPLARGWYSGLTDRLGLHDLMWIEADGTPLHGAAWRDPLTRVLGCLIGRPGRARAPLLLLVNADPVDREFLLPAGVWQALLDSTHPRGVGRWHGQGEVAYPLAAHSVHLLAVAGADIDLPEDDPLP